MVGEKIWLQDKTWNRLEKVWKKLETDKGYSVSVDEVILFLISEFESEMEK